MAHKLPGGLYALLDDAVKKEIPLEQQAQAVIDAKVNVLQLRLKHTSDRQALLLIRTIVDLARPQGTVVIVNDRVDLALSGNADGVHLGDDDVPADVARRLLGEDAVIGVTTRALADIEHAQGLGADYVGLGPLFTTTTKVLAQAPLGLIAFREIVARSPLPVVGIAGITLETIGEVAAAGAWGAAVASGLFQADDLVSRARALQQAFCGSR